MPTAGWPSTSGWRSSPASSSSAARSPSRRPGPRSLPHAVHRGLRRVRGDRCEQPQRQDRGLGDAADRALRRELAVFTFLACLGTIASAGFLQGTQFLAATVAPADELASFAAAVTLVAPIQFLPRALALAMFPSMSAAHGAGHQ